MAKVETVEVSDGKGGIIVVNKTDADKYAAKPKPKPKAKARAKAKSKANLEYK